MGARSDMYTLHVVIIMFIYHLEKSLFILPYKHKKDPMILLDLKLMMITIGNQKIVYKLKCITSATMNKKFGFAGQSLTVSYVMCTVFAYNFFFLN